MPAMNLSRAAIYDLIEKLAFQPACSLCAAIHKDNGVPNAFAFLTPFDFRIKINSSGELQMWAALFAFSDDALADLTQ